MWGEEEGEGEGDREREGGSSGWHVDNGYAWIMIDRGKMKYE